MKQQAQQAKETRSTGKWYESITATDIMTLSGGGKKLLFVIWNCAAMLLSSAALCGACLNFAIGRYPLFYIYLGYFKNPEIFLLNWIPVLLIQFFFYALLNRQWTAFLGTAFLALAMSLGNYFKLIFRSDPFVFDDMSSILAGLTVAGEYDVKVDWRILLVLLFTAAAAVILFFCAKGHARPGTRLILAAGVLLSAILLWHTVYSDGNRYYENSYTNYLFVTRDKRDNFVANGFFYPFLYSITESSNTQPDGYDEQTTAEQYAAYHNAEIPDGKKLNVMVLQLESFCDLGAMGVNEIAKEVYQPLHELQTQSYSGTMIANVIGGGTINTERAVMTGCWNQQDYYKPAYSYIRYLNSQGFETIVTHPNDPNFYARKSVNSNLGFQTFYNLENYFGEITDGLWRCDESYLPEVFRIFREKAEDDQQPVFMFNVSLQGHSPYNTESYDRESNLWNGDGASEQTAHALNNYLSCVFETQRVLAAEIEKIQDSSAAMVLMIYGDHKPWFGDEVYQELGLQPNMGSEQAMIDYLGTPYVLLANTAAEKLLGHELSGRGPMVSPGYLMNLLFEQLGWEGPAFMQYTSRVMAQIPVICTRGGYVENGKYCRSLSEEGKQMLKDYQNMTYYVHLRPTLAETESAAG